MMFNNITHKNNLIIAEPNFTIPKTKHNKNKKQNAYWVKGLNDRNKEIRSIEYPSIKMHIFTEDQSISLNGSLSFSKDKNFRLVCHSFWGKEADIGSNDREFWFWSKRMSPIALYYSSYENILNTRLRTIFNPLWIMDSLCLNEFDGEVFQYKDKLAILKETTAARNQKVKKITLVDPKTLTVTNQYLFDSNDNILLSSETEFEDNVPKKIRIVWYEDNVVLVLDFCKPIVNKFINNNIWRMPDYPNKIDLNKI